MILRVLIALLVVANVASALAVVYDRHRHRQLFVQITRLEKARDDLNIDFGRLQLEQATLGDSNRVDQIAREQLGMQFPDAGQTVVIRP